MNEKPITVPVFAELLTVNPAEPAAPPDAPSKETPLTVNWNPAILISLSYPTS